MRSIIIEACDGSPDEEAQYTLVNNVFKYLPVKKIEKDFYYQKDNNPGRQKIEYFRFIKKFKINILDWKDKQGKGIEHRFMDNKRFYSLMYHNEDLNEVFQPVFTDKMIQQNV